ncbi:MAG: 6-bladed beta-propeller [Deltaproteobacteria bacterium]|nr:MAG: 6-bladed beta-propeller [Deltaproteobacteria bacterium]
MPQVGNLRVRANRSGNRVPQRRPQHPLHPCQQGQGEGLPHLSRRPRRRAGSPDSQTGTGLRPVADSDQPHPDRNRRHLHGRLPQAQVLRPGAAGAQRLMKKEGMNRFRNLLLWAGLLLLLAACSAPQPQQVRKRYFWPPGDIAPKIEYINFYHADQDVRRGVNDWLEETIFGKDRPRRAFVRPSVVASDGKGRLFVADQGLSQVQVWDFNTHEIRHLRYPSGASFAFQLPAGMTLDDAGHIYVSDSLRKQILVFDDDELVVREIENGALQRPTGLAFDPVRGGLYVVDTAAHKVHFFDRAGKLVSSIGGRGVAPGQFNFPVDCAVDSDGNLFVLDSMNARVQVFDREGGFVRAFGERGTALGSFMIPKSIAVSPSNLVYVTDSQAHKFVVFSREGDFLLTVGGEAPMVDGKVSPGGFYLPEGIDIDSGEAIWVVDSLNRMVHQFQYLTPEYLAAHPILPGQAFMPPVLQKKLETNGSLNR